MPDKGIDRRKDGKIDRREFLKGAAVLAGALVTTFVLPGCKEKPSTTDHLLRIDPDKLVKFKNCSEKLTIRYDKGDTIKNVAPLYFRCHQRTAPEVVDLSKTGATCYLLKQPQPKPTERKFGEILDPRLFELENTSKHNVFVWDEARSRSFQDDEKAIEPGEKEFGILVLTANYNSEYGIERPDLVETAKIRGKEKQATLGWAICRIINIPDPANEGEPMEVLQVKGFAYGFSTLSFKEITR